MNLLDSIVLGELFGLIEDLAAKGFYVRLQSPWMPPGQWYCAILPHCYQNDNTIVAEAEGPTAADALLAAGRKFIDTAVSK